MCCRKLLYRILVTILLLLLVGCYNHNSALLERAESIVTSYPDSALNIMDLIDVETLKKSDRAKYALLYTIAQDKSYIDVNSDSLIKIAVDYYDGNVSDLYYQMLSFYYMARVCQNAQDYPKAIVYAERAKNIAENRNYNFYLGMVYRCMAEINNATYNTPQELEHSKKSYYYFSKTDSLKHKLYALSSLASAYANNRMHDSCIRLCDSILKIPCYNQLKYESLITKAYSCKLNNDYIDAKNSIILCRELYPNYLGAYDYAILAELYARESVADSASVYIELAKSKVVNCRDSIAIYRASYEICKYKEDYANAIYFMNKMNMIQDSIVGQMLDESILRAQRDFYVQESIDLDNKIEDNKRKYGILISIIVVLVIILVIILYYRFQGHKRLLAQATESILELRHIVRTRDSQLSNMQKAIKDKIDKHSDTMDRLCRVYYSVSSTKEKKALANEVLKIITDLKANETILEIKNQLNECSDGIVDRLQIEIVGLKDSEINLFMFLCLGFSSATISLLMDEKIQNIYVKKARLKRKIIESSARDKIEFLEIMLK